jgi:hypothetical protein
MHYCTYSWHPRVGVVLRREDVTNKRRGWFNFIPDWFLRWVVPSIVSRSHGNGDVQKKNRIRNFPLQVDVKWYTELTQLNSNIILLCLSTWKASTQQVKSSNHWSESWHRTYCHTIHCNSNSNAGSQLRVDKWHNSELLHYSLYYSSTWKWLQNTLLFVHNQTCPLRISSIQSSKMSEDLSLLNMKESSIDNWTQAENPTRRIGIGIIIQRVDRFRWAFQCTLIDCWSAASIRRGAMGDH